MKKLLVTGGLGFIGSHFIIDAIGKGYMVVNLDKETYAANFDNVQIIQNHKNYKFVKGDICDEVLVNRLFKEEGFDIVVNFAAESHVDRSINDPDIFIETNVKGTNVLLKNSLEFDLERFVQISTDEVYGDLELNDNPFTEEDDLMPNSPYSASKASSDMLVRAYHVTYGLPIVITRCSNNFGPHQDGSKLIPVIVKKAMNDESIPIYGDGKNIRDWIYVKDHVSGIFAAIEEGKNGEIYNFGGNMELDNLSLCKKILSILGKPESLIAYVEDRKGHDFRYAINDTKSQKELGWKRAGGFDENLRSTIAYMKEHVVGVDKKYGQK